MELRLPGCGALALALTLVAACSGDKDPNLSDTDASTGKETSAGETSTSTATTEASTSTATTAGPTTDPSTGSTSTTTSGGFLQPMDGGSVSQCDPGLQDCPDGEKCSPYVSTPGYCCVDATQCVQVIGMKQYGEPCTRDAENDDCDVGLFCMTMTSGSTGEGICLQMCSVDDQDTCPAGDCIAFNDGFLPLCEESCDPLIQNCDGDGFGCYAVLANDKFICAKSGYELDKGGDGDECYTIQSCKPGLVCIAGQVQEGCVTERCCTPVCDLSGGGEECVSALEECASPWAQGDAPPAYTDVGLCTIPE